MAKENPSSISTQLANAILVACSESRTEEDLRIRVEKILDPILKKLKIQENARYEKGTRYGTERQDAVHGNLTIEYEKPNSFKYKRLFDHAVRQVIDQLSSEAGEGKKKEDSLRKLAGVVLDGTQIGFITYRGAGRKEAHFVSGFFVDGPQPVSEESMAQFLRYFRALRRRPLTAESLAQEFGPKSAIAQSIVNSFYNILLHRSTNQIKTFLNEWERIFGIVYGEDLKEATKDVPELDSLYGFEESPQIHPKLFAVHTYYCLLMKLIAREILSLQQGAFVQSFVAGLTTLSKKEFQDRFKNLEDGEYFKYLGIKNFLEGDFFRWYISAWDENLDKSLRAFVNALSDFEPTTASMDPSGTWDLLKKLYQYLLPKKLRHDLGEYYTPDWLAERLLNQLGYDGNPDKRILDPSCGSGTFLVLAISRAREFFEKTGPHDRESREKFARKILTNIVGFDLNPLAVLAARTNYLLQMGDLIRTVSTIEIPVYLCDSILTPRHAQEFFKFDAKGKPLELFEFKEEKITDKEETEVFGKKLPQKTLKIDVKITPAFTQSGPLGMVLDTSVGQFIIPQEFKEKETLSKLSDILEEMIERKESFEDFSARLKHAQIKTTPATEKLLKELYENLLNLHKENRNKIWARFIKNSFAPVFSGQFDYVAGNPPWVNWESLAQSYRDKTKFLWERYGLFSLKGHEARLGGGKKDLSMLFTYACMDNYLKEKGKLGFIITQSIFKTKGAGDGFRRFQLGDGTHLKVEYVDDLTELQPFEGATNRTAILILKKGEKTKYPLPYEYWQKKPGEKPEPDWTLDEVSKWVKLLQFSAKPVNENEMTSPWITGRTQVTEILKKVMGQSDYRAYAGACTWLNGVYWIKILEKRPDGLLVIENLNDIGKEKVKKVQAEIEPDLVYPLLRGRDVKKWRGAPSVFMLMTQDPKTRTGFDEKWLKTELPKTYSYLKQFEEELRGRSGYKKYFDPKKDPFYSIYNAGEYTFAPYKAVWPWISADVKSAVIQSDHKKVIVPEHNTSFVAFNNFSEAFFFSACLNSTPASFCIRSSSSGGGGGIASPKVLEHIKIPKFDPKSKLHQELSELSKEAHEVASKELDSRSPITNFGDRLRGNDKPSPHPHPRPRPRAERRSQEERIKQIEEKIDEKAAELWGISPKELSAIRSALKELQ